MANQDPSIVVAAFTEEQVERLRGIRARQLREWDRSKFFVPSLAYEDRSKPFARLYSFRDVVCLKVINSLRNESRVSLQHLRGVKEKLSHIGDDLWAKTTLYVLNRKVIFDHPETKAKEEIISGQGVLRIPLEVVTGNMSEAVKKMRERSSGAIGKIEIKKRLANSKPFVAGTRIPVASIKAFAEEGFSVEQMLREHPTLTDDDVRAAIAYGAAA